MDYKIQKSPLPAWDGFQIWEGELKVPKGSGIEDGEEGRPGGQVESGKVPEVGQKRGRRRGGVRELQG